MELGDSPNLYRYDTPLREISRPYPRGKAISLLSVEGYFPLVDSLE